MRKFSLLCFFSVVLFIESFPQSVRPNILFIIADDAGLDYSVYGSSYVHTPAFDRIARGGLLFSRAYTPNAKCAPSRSCILTGRNSWQLEAAANHVVYFPVTFKTFPEALLNAGYRTGYTGKGYAPGKALWEDGRPRELIGAPVQGKLTEPPTSGISKVDYAGNFNTFLDTVAGQPWFFWIGMYEPHRVYEYGSGVRKGGKNAGQIGKVPAYWPDSDTVKNDMLDYALEIEYADRQVEKILQMLEKKGILENTLVVFTSDHGMPFPRVKGNQYEAANHVPMAVMWKKGIMSPGRKIDDYISFIDLAPTFLEVAGSSVVGSGMHPVSGKSLVPLFTSKKSGQVDASRDYVLVGQERHDIGRPGDVGYPIRGIYSGNMLYLKNYKPDRWPACNPETGYLNTDGGATKTFILNQRRSGVEKKYWKLCFGHRVAEELYDLKNDPDCVNNLMKHPDFHRTASKMRTRMEKELTAQGDLRMLGFGHIYEQYPGVEMNNFYERFMKGESFQLNWINPEDIEKEIITDY